MSIVSISIQITYLLVFSALALNQSKNEINTNKQDVSVRAKVTRKIFDGEKVKNIINSKHDELCYSRHVNFTLNFTIPGRTISEIKCLEYIWESKAAEHAANDEDWCRQVIIEGGRPAYYGEFPHMGAVGWRSATNTNEWIFKCGATLISKQFLLTAAHCSRVSMRDRSVAKPWPEIVKIGDKFTINNRPERIEDYYEFYDMISGRKMYGRLNFNKDVAPKYVPIKRFIQHKDYKSPKRYYDIAIIELEGVVQFGPLIRPACLWNSQDTSDLDTLLITGWGIINSARRQTTTELHVAEVNVIDQGVCDEKLHVIRNRNWPGLAEHQICAGRLSGGVDTCQGDSGGPLQVKMNLSQTWPMYFIVGVTSFGSGCARADLPGVYVRASSFMDWIESTVWPDG